MHIQGEIRSKMDRSHTDFLVAEDSFLTGAAAIFNLGGSFYTYNRSATPQAADRRAIAQDFAMIGQDIRDTVETVKKEQAATQCSLAL
jgi:hypothetical protein